MAPLVGMVWALVLVAVAPLPAADAGVVAGWLGRVVSTLGGVCMLGAVAVALGADAGAWVWVAAPDAVWEAAVWSLGAGLGSAAQAAKHRVMKASCDAVLFIPSAPAMHANVLDLRVIWPRRRVRSRRAFGCRFRRSALCPAEV
jgi:hypothetical protein